jgi:hypothetical protein
MWNSVTEDGLCMLISHHFLFLRWCVLVVVGLFWE